VSAGKIDHVRMYFGELAQQPALLFAMPPDDLEELR
jgi:hypothetical protein